MYKLVNILIADNQPVIIEGIKSILKQFNNINIIEEAEDKNSLFIKLNALKYNILIIDISSLQLFEIKEMALIEKSSPYTNVFIFTNNDQENEILSLLEYPSVKAYHLKNCKKVDFIRAITVVANNGKSFCDSVIEILHNSFSKTKQRSKSVVKIKELTKREIEVVKLVAEGRTAKEISDKLFISIHTVNTYRKNILQKLKVKNSSELVMFAIKNNLIDSSEYFI